MKLEQLFRIGVEAGIAADPRGKKRIEKELKKYQDKKKKLEKEELKFFDEERTWNPFSDSRIIAGTGKEDVKRLMVGIDIETAEMLLADRLNQRGDKIDGFFMHHPEGRALADLEKIMPMQIDVLACSGVPVNQAEGYMRPRMEKIWRAIHPDNLFRHERAAQLLGFVAFNIHTPADNLVYQFITKTICEKEFDSLGEIVSALHEIPEYEQYAKKGNPVIIANGSRDGRPGKVVASEFTGGTNGPEEFMELQANAGVGTILTMHTTDKSLEAAKKHHVNLIQCSHIASDTIGVNLMLDIMSRKEKNLSVVEASGFIRVKRR
ncbi:MAG: hypothetical protein PHU04_00280 [Candidatus Peribacteraceae bacterium]|nr:hypothetical protein [Candidatus Peribacteraceae bacterium]